MLKTWIPLLDTKRLANIWYEYPDSVNYEHSGRYTFNKKVQSILEHFTDDEEYWIVRHSKELLSQYEYGTKLLTN